VLPLGDLAVRSPGWWRHRAWSSRCAGCAPSRSGRRRACSGSPGYGRCGGSAHHVLRRRGVSSLRILLRPACLAKTRGRRDRLAALNAIDHIPAHRLSSVVKTTGLSRCKRPVAARSKSDLRDRSRRSHDEQPTSVADADTSAAHTLPTASDVLPSGRLSLGQEFVVDGARHALWFEAELFVEDPAEPW
jgi:hypothetical protein